MDKISKLHRIVLILMLATIPASVLADPCLVVYPTGDCVYRYDPAEYYTVGPGHPLYDPLYDRGGSVLLELGSGEIDHSIYQAPNIVGFAESTDSKEGYVFMAADFDLVIDGWSNEPTTLVNILLVFDSFAPDGCAPAITVEGMPLPGPDGYVYTVGDLVVATPTASGRNYSDTVTVSVSWSGCYGMRMWAFADENHNGVHDGGECFTAFSHDAAVPAANRSWSAVKTLFE